MSYPLLPILATLLLVSGLIVCLRMLVRKRKNMEDFGDFLARLEREDLLLKQRFRATRAFAVQEFEDEGSQYFIELEDRGILFLTGQYLYEFEPNESQRAPTRRRFPCTEFTLLRHRGSGDVLDILCAGEVLEPEFEAVPFSVDEWESGAVPGDGEILTSSYESLKRGQLARASARS